MYASHEFLYADCPLSTCSSWEFRTCGECAFDRLFFWLGEGTCPTTTAMHVPTQRYRACFTHAAIARPAIGEHTWCCHCASESVFHLRSSMSASTSPGRRGREGLELFCLSGDFTSGSAQCEGMSRIDHVKSALSVEDGVQTTGAGGGRPLFCESFIRCS